MPDPDFILPTSTPEVQAWAVEVNYVATRKKLDATAIAKAARPQLSPQLVRHWLEGNDVPRSQAQHDALMQALSLIFLPAQLEDDSLKTPAQRELAVARGNIEEAYTSALKSVENAPETTWSARVKRPPTQPAAKKTDNPREQTHDAKGTPEREYRVDGLPALVPKGWGRKDYLDIANRTENIHEFIRCHRLASDITQEGLAQTSGYESQSAIHLIEVGRAIPRIESLHNMANALFSANITENTNNRAKLERLSIENRLEIMKAIDPRQESAGYIFGNQRSELPPIYWRETIDQLLNPNAARTRPEWAESIIPITTQNAYYHAMRNMLSLTAETVSDTTGVHKTCIQQIEGGSYEAGGDAQSYQSLATFYEQGQKDRANTIAPLPHLSKADSNRPFFDKKKLHSLPLETGLEAKKNAYAARNAARNSNTDGKGGR